MQTMCLTERRLTIGYSSDREGCICPIQRRTASVLYERPLFHTLVAGLQGAYGSLEQALFHRLRPLTYAATFAALLSGVAAAGPSNETPQRPELIPTQSKRTTESDIRNANTEDIIRLYMSRKAFFELGRRLQLDAVQTAHLEELFGSYDRRVQKLKEQLLSEILTPLMRHIRAVEDGEDQPRGPESATVRFVGDKVVHCERKVTRLLASLLDQLQACLSETQLVAYPSAIHAWRRSVMLNPNGKGSRFDLSVHVDLFDVVASACQQEEEFRMLLDQEAEPAGDPKLAQARQRCLELLGTYELELDQLIQRQFSRGADRFFKGLQEWADGDVKGAEQRLRSGRRDWMKVYRLNTNVAETLASIIEESYGASLSRAWRDHYYAAYYPVLCGAKSTDHLYEWLVHEADLTLEEQRATQAIYARYTDRRRALEARARAMLLDIAEELNLSSPGQLAANIFPTPSRKTRLDERRRALSASANTQFREILTDDQQLLVFDKTLASITASGGLSVE